MPYRSVVSYTYSALSCVLCTAFVTGTGNSYDGRQYISTCMLTGSMNPHDIHVLLTELLVTDKIMHYHAYMYTIWFLLF